LILAISGEVIGGLSIALVLKKKFRGRGLVLAAVIIPWALPPVTNGVIWKWIYNPTYGVLNDIFLKLHIISTNQVWLGDARFSLLCVTLVHIWKMIPLTAVILLAALQTISDELYAAINLFDEIFVLTGTALDTRSILVQDYLIAFRQLDLGLGMSLSLIITVITLAISLFYVLWLNEKEVKKA